VSAQNLTPDEVQRMNYERETLSRQQEELRFKIAEASQQAYDQEMSVTRSMDRFEQLLADYTALGHQIGTIPPLSEGPMLGPDEVDYSIDLDLGVEDVNEITSSGRRLRSEIWPALQIYGEGFRKETVHIQDGNIMLDDRQKEEAANLDMRLKVVNDQAEHAKAVSLPAPLGRDEG
jgi:kinetochore protein NDC80